MIGATALHGIAKAVEQAAKAHDLPTVRGMHDVFRHEVQRVANQVGSAG
jgi:hypothetical protein